MILSNLIKGTLILFLFIFMVNEINADDAEKMTITYSQLSEENLNKYRLELNKDSEFVRTSNLENSLINKYGFEGLKLIFESRNSENYHLLGSFPKGSPWFSLNNKNMTEAIDIIFEPIKTKIPKLVTAMKERVILMYVEQKGTDWTLHYLLNIKLYDDRDYYRIYSGGMPNPDAAANKNLLKFDWSVPKDLKDFYKIHDGFGEYDSTFILSSEQITVMAEMMNPILEEQKTKPEGYSFDDLLEFFPDGAGNAQCFIRVGKENNSTVDWDHEVWEVSEKVNFYEFVDERMGELDEE